MKKLLYILPIALLPVLSCGGGGEQTESEEGTAEETSVEAEATGVSTDLSEFGMDYSIILPDKSNVETVIASNDWGGIDIKQGEGFILSIEYGEGDIDLLKFDMEDDLVYKYEILDEGENYLVYKREIEGSGMDPEYHFMYVIRLEGDAIEVQNSKDVTFSEESISAMLSAAKSMSVKGGA